jgi:hypothetical protein
MSKIVIEGRSVGKSTDLVGGLQPWKVFDVDEETCARVRREFIELFPALAPLMYSIPIVGAEPTSVDSWLSIMQHELDRAHRKRNRYTAIELFINEEARS